MCKGLEQRERGVGDGAPERSRSQTQTVKGFALQARS